MALRNKIDSNETSLFYAEEASLGVLPAVPVWTPLEPNEYSDFGGELTLLSRNPINSSRQRKKGVITDLDAAGGFQQDFTQTNFQDLLQGFMFADFRKKFEAVPTNVVADGYTAANAAAVIPGAIVNVSGYTNPANNGNKVVTGVDVNVIEVTGLVVEAAPAVPAVMRQVGIMGVAGDLSVTVVPGGYPIIESATLDFTAMGLIPGEWIFVGGDGLTERFTDDANNGFKRIQAVRADAIVIDSSVSEMTDDSGAGLSVALYFGRVLKNELGPLIKRRSYQLERQLGAPDPAQPNQIQAEYIKGAVANEFTLNIATADKITADVAFVAIDNDQRTATEGLKPGTRASLVETDAFNTSSDFASLRLAVRAPGVYAPEPLFAYLTEMSVVINNNVSPNKAVAVLGAFDVTAGTFEVTAEATAYFTTIEAVRAVRNNADVGLYAAVAKDNAGFIFDLPLIALGDAQNDVAADEPITLPLAMDAATAAKYGTDFTIMWVFFDYLPDIANPNN